MGHRWVRQETETVSNTYCDYSTAISLESTKGDMMQMKIQIVRGKKGGWFFRFVARNGRTLCHSEIYSSLAGCMKTASKLRDIMIGVRIEILED